MLGYGETGVTDFGLKQEYVLWNAASVTLLQFARYQSRRKDPPYGTPRLGGGLTHAQGPHVA